MIFWTNGRTSYVFDKSERKTYRVGEFEVMSKKTCLRVFLLERIMENRHPIRFDKNPYHVISIINELNSEIRRNERRRYERAM